MPTTIQKKIFEDRMHFLIFLSSDEIHPPEYINWNWQSWEDMVKNPKILPLSENGFCSYTITCRSHNPAEAQNSRTFFVFHQIKGERVVSVRTQLTRY